MTKEESLKRIKEYKEEINSQPVEFVQHRSVADRTDRRKGGFDRYFWMDDKLDRIKEALNDENWPEPSTIVDRIQAIIDEEF